MNYREKYLKYKKKDVRARLQNMIGGRGIVSGAVRDAKDAAKEKAYQIAVKKTSGLYIKAVKALQSFLKNRSQYLEAEVKKSQEKVTKINDRVSQLDGIITAVDDYNNSKDMK
jgi:hypothetical protein